jgi:PKD repeat protein
MKLLRIILVLQVLNSLNSNVFSQILPNQLPGLIGWYNSQNTINNGVSISQLTDLSGNNFHLSQANSLKRPNLIGNSLGNFPSIAFDGINDNLKVLYGSSLATNSTIFIITNNLLNGNTFVYDGGNSFYSLRNQGNLIYMYVTGGGISYGKTNPYNYTLFNQIYNTGNSKIYENGNLKIQGNVNSANLDGFTLGSYYGQDSYFFKGQVLEVVIYNRVLTDSERTSIQNFIMNKYGPPINLGPDLISTYGFCNLTVGVQNTTLSNFLWSTGSNTPTITINSPGQYWLQATDIFGRISRDTIEVIRPVYDSIQLPNYLVCFNEPQTISAFIPSGNYSFVQWNDGSTNQSRILNQNEIISYTISDSLGCTRNSNFGTITVDNSLQNISLGIDTNLCSGNSIQLIQDTSAINQWLWSNGSNSENIIIDTTGQYVLEVTNANNCRNQDTIEVTIIGTSPTLQFTFSDTLCQYSQGSFSDNSFIPNNNGTISTKTWSISEGTTLSGSFGNFSIDTSGTFNVTLLVETVEGCSSNISFPIVVHSKPSISFITQNYCPYEAIQFTPQNSFPIGIGSHLWNFNQNNNTSTASNPSYSFGQSGIFNVSLQAEDINGCRDTIVQPVYIQPAPVADFSFNNTCELSAVNFANNSSIADTFSLGMSQWTYGDGTASTNPAIQKVYQGYGEYDVQLVVTANNGCQDTLSQTITIHPKPILGWQVGPACKNTWTSFENQSTIPIGSITQTDWLVNLQYPFEGPSSEFLFVTTGEQYLNLTSTSDQGCSTDTLIIVNVQPEIIAAFTVSPTTVVAGVPVVFTNNSLGGTSYEWNLGNNTIYQTTVAEPAEATGFASSFIGDSILTYLAIQNAIGCKDTAYQYVKVNEPRIDLAINQLFVQDINGFYKVGVELRNLGFVEITQTDLLLKLYNSSPILETETESLAPGESRIYLFNANPSAYISTQDNEISFLCVEATSYNDYQLVESEFSNNISCLNTEGGNFVLLPIYPNPTNNDVTYTLIVSEESSITTSLTDETGRIVQSSTELYTSGLYTPTISMRSLSAGVYYFQISDGLTSKTVKVLKN